jgi:hypothetical protein
MSGRRIGRHDDERHAELISASLSRDLDEHEERELRAHLAGCATCAATLASFNEQRRLVSGMRHVPLPRDMGARVRAGIESGRFAPLPWWRRPAGIAAAAATAGTALAAGVLAAVLLATPGDPQVAGDPSPTPQPTPEVTASPAPTPVIGPSPTQTPQPTPEPQPTEPQPTEPQPVIADGTIGYLTLSGRMAELQLDLVAYDPQTREIDAVTSLARPAGAPVAVAISPDRSWLAYQIDGGGLDANEVWIADPRTGAAESLGRTDGSAFAKRMAWSNDGRFLAFTAADVETGSGPDVWLFDTQTGERRQVTDTGRAYAASVVGGSLWISLAGETPISYSISIDAGRDAPLSAEDLVAGDARWVEQTLGEIFLPILSPDGERSIFWRGQMASFEPRWEFVGGGMLYVGGGTGSGPFASDQALFPTLVAGREAFATAEIAWSHDSDWFSVWNAQWTGPPQGSPGTRPFPDSQAIYFGRASTGDLVEPDDFLRLIGDAGAIVDVAFVEHVFGGDVPALAVTILDDIGGHAGESPGPQGRLVLTPASGSSAALPLGEDADWAGPAFYVAPED